jgi:hypothetical protein
MRSMGDVFLFNVVDCKYRFDAFSLIYLSQTFIVISLSS